MFFKREAGVGFALEPLFQFDFGIRVPEFVRLVFRQLGGEFLFVFAADLQVDNVAVEIGGQLVHFLLQDLALVLKDFCLLTAAVFEGFKLSQFVFGGLQFFGNCAGFLFEAVVGLLDGEALFSGPLQLFFLIPKAFQLVLAFLKILLQLPLQGGKVINPLMRFVQFDFLMFVAFFDFGMVAFEGFRGLDFEPEGFQFLFDQLFFLL